jgi:hypothetical protein
MQDDLNAHLGRLPGSFRSSQSAANDVEFLCHVAAI